MSDHAARENAPPSLDPVASARWLAGARAPWLHDEIGLRMADRLQWIRQAPTLWVDWWPLLGGLQAHARVRAQYPQARVQLVEFNAARNTQALAKLRAPAWQRWLGRDRLLPQAPPPGSAHMLWANMALHLVADPMALLQQWQQLLAVDGFVMFSGLGPDTLRELAEVYRQHGWPAPSHAFTDMHDWGDMLVQSGFAEPVMDMERLTLTYETPQALLQDLRLLGRNLHAERFAALRGRGWLVQLQQALLSLAQPQHDGRLAVTVEVIYGHALKAAPRLRVASTSTVSLQDMRAMLKPDSK